MNWADVITFEWPSLVLAACVALITGPLFGLSHDVYKVLLSPWVTRQLYRLRARFSRAR